MTDRNFSMVLPNDVLTYDMVVITQREFDMQDGNLQKVQELINAKAKLASRGMMKRILMKMGTL